MKKIIYLLVISVSLFSDILANENEKIYVKKYKTYAIKMSKAQREEVAKDMLKRIRMQEVAKKYQNYMHYNSHYKPSISIINKSYTQIPPIRNNAGNWNRGCGDLIRAKSKIIQKVYCLNQVRFIMKYQDFIIYQMKYKNQDVYILYNK